MQHLRLVQDVTWQYTNDRRSFGAERGHGAVQAHCHHAGRTRFLAQAPQHRCQLDIHAGRGGPFTACNHGWLRLAPVCEISPSHRTLHCVGRWHNGRHVKRPDRLERLSKTAKSAEFGVSVSADNHPGGLADRAVDQTVGIGRFGLREDDHIPKWQLAHAAIRAAIRASDAVGPSGVRAFRRRNNARRHFVVASLATGLHPAAPEIASTASLLGVAAAFRAVESPAAQYQGLSATVAGGAALRRIRQARTGKRADR